LKITLISSRWLLPGSPTRVERKRKETFVVADAYPLREIEEQRLIRGGEIGYREHAAPLLDHEEAVRFVGAG